MPRVCVCLHTYILPNSDNCIIFWTMLETSKWSDPSRPVTNSHSQSIAAAAAASISQLWAISPPPALMFRIDHTVCYWLAATAAYSYISPGHFLKLFLTEILMTKTTADHPSPCPIPPPVYLNWLYLPATYYTSFVVSCKLSTWKSWYLTWWMFPLNAFWSNIVINATAWLKQVI